LPEIYRIKYSSKTLR